MIDTFKSYVPASFVRRVVLPAWARRDHPLLHGFSRDIEAAQYLSPENLESLQLKRLREQLKHAETNCAFYRERMRTAGLSAEEITSVGDICQLPILTKRDIQDNADGLTATNISSQERVRNQTGGSTGSPLQFWVDKARLDSRMASTLRHNLWAGLRPGEWCAQLWGARLDQINRKTLWDELRNALIYRLVELNTSSVSERDWAELVARLRQLRPAFMIAYAQSAFAFAQYVEQNNISDIQFRSIITTAEVLLPGQREYIERVLGGEIFDRYGCRELSVIASECSEHQGLHVNADSLLLEIVPEPGLPDGWGKVVITDLLNRSMPLIRYEIGDVGSWAEQRQCVCGRGLPRLKAIEGRTTDFLVLCDGRKISGPSLTLVVADMHDVRQVQFVQRSETAIALKVVPGEGYGSGTVAELRKRIGLYLRGAAELRIEEVASIAKEPSGKYRFVVQERSAKQTEQHARA